MKYHFDPKAFDNFLIANDVVEFRDEKVKLSSGRHSNIYVNARKLMNSVEALEDLMWYVNGFVKHKGLKPDYFLGVPDGMTKLGVVMTYVKAKNEINLRNDPYIIVELKSHPFPIVRKKVKKHGNEKGKRFLGNLSGKAIVLEDVVTTGDSLISLIKDLKDNNVDVLAAIGLVDRLELRKDGLSVSEKFSDLCVDYYSLTSVKTLLPLACEKLKPSKDLVKKINKYYKKYGCNDVKIII